MNEDTKNFAIAFVQWIDWNKYERFDDLKNL